jgi:hypothetical protein
MTQKEQRIALAEWDGWMHTSQEVWKTGGPHHMLGAMGQQSLKWVDYIPDYPNDLNAVHELEKKLTPEQRQEYVKLLHPKYKISALLDDFEVAHSSSTKRCEKLCRVLFPNKFKTFGVEPK